MPNVSRELFNRLGYQLCRADAKKKFCIFSQSNLQLVSLSQGHSPVFLLLLGLHYLFLGVD